MPHATACSVPICRYVPSFSQMQAKRREQSTYSPLPSPTPLLPSSLPTTSLLNHIVHVTPTSPSLSPLSSLSSPSPPSRPFPPSPPSPPSPSSPSSPPSPPVPPHLRTRAGVLGLAAARHRQLHIVREEHPRAGGAGPVGGWGSGRGEEARRWACGGVESGWGVEVWRCGIGMGVWQGHEAAGWQGRKLPAARDLIGGLGRRVGAGRVGTRLVLVLACALALGLRPYLPSVPSD